MRQIKFADLRVQDKELVSVVAHVMGSGRFIKGEFNQRFAERWAQICGAGHCVPVSSGTDALVVALKALELEPMAKVVIPDLSFAATAFAVIEAGCEPVFCDVTSQGLIDWNRCIEILDETDAQVVIPVNLYGQVFEIPMAVFNRATIIEDACQAHWTHKLRGTMACYSFYPSKNLGAVGDAGAVVMDSGDLRSKVELLCTYGEIHKNDHIMVGRNYRMDEIQAAILLHRSRDLRQTNDQRFRIAHSYNAEGVCSFAKYPCAWHLYPILAKEPEDLAGRLSVEGIETGRHYPYTLKEISPGTSTVEGYCSDLIAKHCLSLPIGPHMEAADATLVATTLKRISHYDDDLGWWL